jgi:hypothetical protein
MTSKIDDAFAVAAEQKRYAQRIEGLFRGILLDGWRVYRCGDIAEQPRALVATFQWRHCTDVIVVPEAGPAGAARVLGHLSDPLNIPTEARCWAASVGPPDSVIWWAHDLPAPDEPDAPRQRQLVPDACRLPEEVRKSFATRVPPESRAGARAARLRQVRRSRQIAQEWFGTFFGLVDSCAAVDVALNFIDDDDPMGPPVLQFGNMGEIVGRTAIAEFTMLLHSIAASVDHRITRYRRVDNEAYTWGLVTFTFHGNGEGHGHEVTVPFSTFTEFRFITSDDPDDPGFPLIARHEVYVDVSPLMPAGNKPVGLVTPTGSPFSSVPR